MSDSVEGTSKRLFNSTHFLTVAAAIGASKSSIDSRGLQEQLGLGQSAVHRVLVVLEGVGLVERSVRGSRTEPVQYARVPHSFWAAVSELVHA